MPSLITTRFLALALLLLISAPLRGGLRAAIPSPADAPKPLAPEASARLVKVPPGFQLQLLASEPLIREPSGVCWDERGRLFVCELHGYNLEGQFDINELNQSGELDRVVRRIQANERAKRSAAADTYGTVKLLRDTDGDGRMDAATVFADRLPPCYGLCPARGGLVVACAPDIVFLADRDDDGVAEVRETLFTGFGTGALERGINAPQWGIDNWIYFGRGHGGGTIRGPHLRKPVALPGTDFRIRPDGSAIEPISGATHTFGFALAESGDRFTATTSVPGLYVTPLPWRYLARNPDAAATRTEQPAAGYTKVFPVAPPHPWRSRRAEDPAFFKYYRDRYGAGDSDAGGWFTSACSPLVYQDIAFPPEYRGHYFICEPAQNLVHHAIVEPDGPGLRLRRAPAEESSEFLASGDPWFHPMNLAHAPDGALCIVDMYREIIEDYSAIPRYLQQQYGLTNGMFHGRIWRLTHQQAPRVPSWDMSRLETGALVQEVASPHFWRRQTARRLLLERKDPTISLAALRGQLQAPASATALNAAYTLEGLGSWSAPESVVLLQHSNTMVRREAMRLAEPWLSSNAVLDRVLQEVNSAEPALLLQAALSLGGSDQTRALAALAKLAREHGDVRWMPQALLSGLHGRAGWMLEELLGNPPLGKAGPLLEPLCASIGARRDTQELARVFARLAAGADLPWVETCLRGLQTGLKGARNLSLTEETLVALQRWQASTNATVRRLAGAIRAMDPAVGQDLVLAARRLVGDVQQPAESRLAAVAQLAGDNQRASIEALIEAWPPNTPKVREAILDAVFARSDRMPALLEALAKQTIPVASLSAFQRQLLVENDSGAVSGLARVILANASRATNAYPAFAAALQQPRDAQHGEQVFRDHCATCHKVRGLGFAVGPDLGAEFQRAEEAILTDILAPNQTISAGFQTYVVETSQGQTVSGILASESATSVMLRQPTGLEQTLLRKDIVRLSSLPVSLMPETLAQALEPREVADVIAWLRDPRGADRTTRRVLFDEEAEFVARLTEGAGRAMLETNGAYFGKACLVVTPPQRYAARIDGWNFRIVEKPGAEEYRYLRLAWRVQGGDGVLLELASAGAWPNARTPVRRYYAGRNTTEWEAREISPVAPTEWRVITLDLWKDNGAFVLTGLAPTAMGGRAFFDRIELLAEVGDTAQPEAP